MLAELKEEIVGILEYDPGLYDEEMITEMAKSYVGLLERAVGDPDGRV
jgi:hypothetical protein